MSGILNDTLQFPPTVIDGTPLQRISRTLAAGAFYNFPCDSEFFYFVEAAFGIVVSFNDGPDIPFNLALGFRLSPRDIAAGKTIKNIRVTNTLAVEVSFDMMVGRGELIDQRLNVIESRSGSAASLVPNGVSGASGVVASGNIGQIVVANPNRKNSVIYLSSYTGAMVSGDRITVTDDVGLVLKLIVIVGDLATFPVMSETGNTIHVMATAFNDTGVAFSINDYSGGIKMSNNTIDDVVFDVSEIIYS